MAGAVAQAGGSLEQVAEAARKAAAACGTMGVALRVCTLPGKSPSDRIKEGEMEVGLGIHGAWHVVQSVRCSCVYARLHFPSWHQAIQTE